MSLSVWIADRVPASHRRSRKYSDTTLKGISIVLILFFVARAPAFEEPMESVGTCWRWR